MTYEIDHLFIAVSPGGAEINALLARGFIEGPGNVHPGQGTACRRIFFENAYLEFIYLTNADEAASEAVRRTRLHERLDLEHPANPFGICIRSGDPKTDEPPFDAWDYRPPYLPEGMAIPVGSNSERLDEPLLFFLPGCHGARWEAPRHPNGAKEMTGLSIALLEADRPSLELRSLLDLNILSTRPGTEAIMEIALNEARGGETADLCPDLPLLIRSESGSSN